MALKIRLSRFGTKHTPVYRIVVAEARSRRDGASVEQLGTYQPRVSDMPLKLNLDRIDYWISRGAKPTETVQGLIKRARRASPPSSPEVESTAAPAEAAPAS